MGPPPPHAPTPSERDAYAQWDQPYTTVPVIRNTRWLSIGVMGFSIAPIVQITVAQQVKPVVDLISVAACFERCGVNV
jgi:hypothetical protein